MIEHEPGSTEAPLRPPRRRRPARRQAAVTLILAAALAGGSFAVTNALSGGGPGCRGELGDWWHGAGGTAYGSVIDGLQAVRTAATAVSRLSGTSTQAQAAADGTALQDASGRLGNASSRAMSALPPGCSAQLTRDFAAFYADESAAASAYGITGQDLASATATGAELTGDVNRAADAQDQANRDQAAVLADLKTITGH